MATTAQTQDNTGGVTVAQSIIQDCIVRLARLADDNDFAAIAASGSDAGRMAETVARISAATFRLAEQHMIAYSVVCQQLADTAERAIVLERIHTAHVKAYDALRAFLLTVGPGFRLDAPEGGAQ